MRSNMFQSGFISIGEIFICGLIADPCRRMIAVNRNFVCQRRIIDSITRIRNQLQIGQILRSHKIEHQIPVARADTTNKDISIVKSNLPGKRLRIGREIVHEDRIRYHRTSDLFFAVDPRD